MFQARRLRTVLMGTGALAVAYTYPDLVALALLFAVAAVAALAAIGGYARWLDRNRRAAPWCCIVAASCTRRALRPRQAAAMCLLAGVTYAIPRVPRHYTDPPWAVHDPYAGVIHQAGGHTATTADGPNLSAERWALIVAAFDAAEHSQWSWDPLLGEASERRATAEWHTFMAKAPSSMGTQPNGSRGVVMTAGGEYLQPAFVSLYILRRSNCTLPIELWTSRTLDGKIGGDWARRFASLGAEVRYVEDALGSTASRRLLAGAMRTKARGTRPFIIKAISILSSSFDQLLFLDADNIVVADPSSLFVSETFLSSGAVLWPDFWLAEEFDESRPEAAVRRIFNFTERPDRRTVEAGQLLLDRHRTWSPLLLSLYILLRAERYAPALRLLYGLYGADGDRCVWPVAWYALNAPFHLVETAPASAGTVSTGGVWW